MNFLGISKKRFFRTYSVFLTFAMALVTVLGTSACNQSVEQSFQGPIMGTQYKLTLACETDKSAQALLDIAVAEMTAVNDSMSTYLADSELNEFNQNKGLDWKSISSDLLKVMEIAQSVSIKSDGAFDVTVSPLVNLWGFGPSREKQLTPIIPNDEKLQAIKAMIGYNKIEINAAKQQWRKQVSNLQVDLSAVAKGYAVDKVSDALVDAGCLGHLVDIGGELKLKGSKNKKGDLWRIAIEAPSFSNTQVSNIQNVLDISDIGVASSGDYRNFYQVDGKRYSHTIDPRTTRPIEHNLAAVTVLHEQTAVADAWATALMVLGDEGPEYAEKNKLAAYFVFRELGVAKGDIVVEDSKNAKKYRIIATKQFEKSSLNK